MFSFSFFFIQQRFIEESGRILNYLEHTEVPVTRRQNVIKTALASYINRLQEMQEEQTLSSCHSQACKASLWIKSSWITICTLFTYLLHRLLSNESLNHSLQFCSWSFLSLNSVVIDVRCKRVIQQLHLIQSQSLQCFSISRSWLKHVGACFLTIWIEMFRDVCGSDFYFSSFHFPAR